MSSGKPYAKKCARCGGQISDTAVKCKHCGEWFSDSHDQEHVKVNGSKFKQCPYCEEPIRNVAGDCKYCKEWSDVQRTTNDQSMSGSGTKKWPNGCNIGCIIVLFVIMILWIIGANSDSPPSTPRKSGDNVLTDEEYENKPYDELSDEEKRQAVDRIADELEEEGVDVDRD